MITLTAQDAVLACFMIGVFIAVAFGAGIAIGGDVEREQQKAIKNAMEQALEKDKKGDWK